MENNGSSLRNVGVGRVLQHCVEDNGFKPEESVSRKGLTTLCVYTYMYTGVGCMVPIHHVHVTGEFDGVLGKVPITIVPHA